MFVVFNWVIYFQLKQIWINLIILTYNVDILYYNWNVQKMKQNFQMKDIGI